VGIEGDERAAGQRLVFPFATKNTTRVGGADPVANAAGVARVVFPAATADTRPNAVVLADQSDWRVALASSVFMAPPVRAPLLFSDGDDLPEASDSALAALGPRGADELGGAQVIRVGNVAKPDGLKSNDLRGSDPFALTAEIDRVVSAARGSPSDRVMVVSADAPAYAMPAAGWAAKSGDPILFVDKSGVPSSTRTALKRHEKPDIYVLGPSSVVSGTITKQLGDYGKVHRIEGADPILNAIEFARFVDARTEFGWGVVDAGHGLVFATQRQPLDAAAAAPLSSSGKYGPLLLVDQAPDLPRPVVGYLLDIQPGYRKNPVRGVYNHGWVIGDERVLSAAAQARMDALLEITPVERPANSS
jgi:hypothetical protein